MDKWDMDAIRERLISDDIDDLSPDDIDEIVCRYWKEFKPLALRWLKEKWSFVDDAYGEAYDRGYFSE